MILPLAFLVGPSLGLGLFAIWLVQGGGRSLQSFIFLSKWRGRRWQSIVM